MRMFLILLPLLLISLFFQVTTTQTVGGWEPIENITDSHVQELGNYAVSEHNRQSGDNLDFLYVMSGAKQFDEATGREKYGLYIEARDAEDMLGLYRALVYEGYGDGYRELKFFNRTSSS
ncbi:Cysteine proteinase inhibitor [Rhynchospora pubera]|uniref:Cysteine proteinase inhibitor n=1 Tax=Rhynchospora pubera TaxID=906938 RepID=A0AAV8HC38_9POAL|nr:Cysteine proteinase inhibitor [Rhynchospora pubera]KAJ4791441.1 Cysteine proteinase inhibitor [Rhynchospora pubera]KAJ4815269.1 Cysteine proteinase inhibitor [Rhynchospora pubera]